MWDYSDYVRLLNLDPSTFVWCLRCFNHTSCVHTGRCCFISGIVKTCVSMSELSAFHVSGKLQSSAESRLMSGCFSGGFWADSEHESPPDTANGIFDASQPQPHHLYFEPALSTARSESCQTPFRLFVAPHQSTLDTLWWQSKLVDELRCLPFLLIIFEMFLHQTRVHLR